VAGGEGGSSTVLMEEAASGDPEVAEAILAAHPDVNASDEKGRTAVWYVLEGNNYWDRRRHANRGQVIHMLAGAGADLDAQDEEGNTALHGAYDENVAKALIEEGADVNIRNKDGNTPLMKNFSVEAAKLLVVAGADVHAKNHEGKTALDFARQLEPEGERAKFLQSVESAKAGRPQDKTKREHAIPLEWLQGRGMLCFLNENQENHMRRGVWGKSSQTFTPQK
jgi:ankyrin repeat protein